MKLFVVIAVLLTTGFVQSQNTLSDLEKEFEAFKQSSNKEFDDFIAKNNAEFAAFLKKNWEQFDVEKPLIPVLKPKPITLPKAPVEKTPHLDSTIIVRPKIVVPLDNRSPDIDNEENLPQKEENESPNESPLDQPLKGRAIEFSFYGVEQKLLIDTATIVKCGEASELAVSKYWSKLSSTNYKSVYNQLILIKEKYQLNDWGIYDYTKKVSENVYSDLNSQIAFQFFYLTQLGYDVKVARAGSSLLLLVNFQQQIYRISYLTIEGKKYFIMTNDQNQSIYTFKEKFSTATKKMDLTVQNSLNFSSTNATRKLAINATESAVQINYPFDNIQFFSQMPQTDFSVYFNSTISDPTLKSLKKSLDPYLVGKSEQEKVQFLLTFVQTSFEYKTDQEQFGREKYFMTDEIIHYPYADCEDRSFFFAQLVRAFVGLEVIGLNYPEHFATAVKFNYPVNGDAVLVNQTKYIVCDPTYIGASIGMCMPQFQQVSPIVIQVRK